LMLTIISSCSLALGQNIGVYVFFQKSDSHAFTASPIVISEMDLEILT